VDTEGQRSIWIQEGVRIWGMMQDWLVYSLSLSLSLFLGVRMAGWSKWDELVAVVGGE